MANRVQKTAVVTGASRGIGASIAERLARDGFAAVINYAGSTTTVTSSIALGHHPTWPRTS